MGNDNRMPEETIVIYIDDDEKERNKFKEDFKLLKNMKVFEKGNKAIEYLKNLQFEEVKIFVKDKLYTRFLLEFKDKAKNMCIIPDIYILTENMKDTKKKFDNDENLKNLNNFYPYNKIITFNKIRNCLIKEIIPKKWIEVNDANITFDYIDSKEDLILPVYYKVLIDKASNNRKALEKYTTSLFEEYSKDNKEIKKLSDNIKSMDNIPIEILSKYFARLYSIESNFYREINKNLREYQVEKHLSFIQTLYEGLNLKALPLASDKKLYRGSTISKDEIEKIKEKIKNKKNDLPGVLAFCKSFLSFTKDKKIAEQFPLDDKDIKKDYFKVLYILEKDDTIKYDLSTHCDLQKISAHPEEQEVLFFPFSSFGIKSINIKNEEKRCEINLLYLGKYLKDYNILVENKLPDSEMYKQLTESGLLNSEKLKNETNKKLVEEFKNKFHPSKPDPIPPKPVPIPPKPDPIPPKPVPIPPKKGIITAEIDIKDNENKNIQIQIINSYENAKKKQNFNNISDSQEFRNEDDIKRNVEITINGKKPPLFYLHKFEKEGKYIIRYKFKKNLTKINHMFYECSELKKLDFSQFNAEPITNMSYIFYNCKSLTNLDLSNFNNKNVVYMKNMFDGCSNLKSIDLSNFDTATVKDMNGLFRECRQLSTLDLSNFKTKTVCDMQCMFQNCQSLSSLNISSFDTGNVADMNSMFDGCSQLESLNLSHFNVKKVIKMNYMFQNCTSLKTLDLPKTKPEHLTEVIGIFKGCENLSSINVSFFETNRITNMSCMFQNCINLTSLDLSNFNTENVTSMESMFEGCVNLKYLNLFNFSDTSLSSTRLMFNGCNSLVRETIIIPENNRIKTEVITRH